MIFAFREKNKIIYILSMWTLWYYVNSKRFQIKKMGNTDTRNLYRKFGKWDQSFWKCTNGPKEWVIQWLLSSDLNSSWFLWYKKYLNHTMALYLEKWDDYINFMFLLHLTPVTLKFIGLFDNKLYSGTYFCSVKWQKKNLFHRFKTAHIIHWQLSVVNANSGLPAQWYHRLWWNYPEWRRLFWRLLNRYVCPLNAFYYITATAKKSGPSDLQVNFN